MTAKLTQPIRAQLDSQLKIVDADAEFRRLHFRAGGTDKDSLAVGSIAALARLCLHYKTNFSRSVRASDGDHDLTLWVEAAPHNSGVAMTITSWHQTPAITGVSPTMAQRVARRPGSNITSAATMLLQLDSALIIRGVSSLGMDMDIGVEIGQPFTAAFVIEDDTDDAALPLLSAIAERSQFSEKPITSRQSRTAFQMSGHPLWDSDRSFAGYACTLQQDRNITPPMAAPRLGGALLTGGNFARELAPVLRQPVGRIIANAETISAKMRGALREGYADYAGDIASAARHLQSLIDDLTDLEAIESAQFQPANDPIDLADLARRVAGLLAVKASDHHIRIIAPDDGVAVPAFGEFRRVLQILLNLVGNAIHYAPDGTQVILQTELNGDRAMVRVIDEGQGIPRADWERVFSKFERLGRHDDGGSGLGLYISRRIADALQGRLIVEHSGAQGTTFLLELPARQ